MYLLHKCIERKGWYCKLLCLLNYFILKGIYIQIYENNKCVFIFSYIFMNPNNMKQNSYCTWKHLAIGRYRYSNYSMFLFILSRYRSRPVYIGGGVKWDNTYLYVCSMYMLISMKSAVKDVKTFKKPTKK